MLNGNALNGGPLNGSAVRFQAVIDWEATAPAERQTVYVLDVGEVRVPISTAQATMQRSGQSSLQVTVPAGADWIDALTDRLGATMQLRKGYRYSDGSLSPLEVIAEAPFQQIGSDGSPSGSSVTLSGHGPYHQTTDSRRPLRAVRYRNTNNGARRVRADVDLFLRPGHVAVDTDGATFFVASIQYYIGAATEFMEVVEHG